MTWRDTIERIAVEHRAETNRLDDRLAAARDRLAARSRELAAAKKVDEPSARTVQDLSRQEVQPEEEPDSYRPSSWLT